MELKDIEKLAQLSRIHLSQEEKELFLKEIDSILAYVGEINKVASTVKEEGKPLLRNVFRGDDKPNETGANTETLLNSAPKRKENYVKVKQIIDQSFEE